MLNMLNFVYPTYNICNMYIQSRTEFVSYKLSKICRMLSCRRNQFIMQREKKVDDLYVLNGTFPEENVRCD